MYNRLLTEAEGRPSALVVPNHDRPLDHAQGFQQVGRPLGSFANIWAVPLRKNLV